MKFPGLVESLRIDLQQNYPNLHIHVKEGIVQVRGTFPIVHDGKILDRYQIAISFPQDYPKSVPRVYEIGGRIPRTSDHHMEQDGTACLFIPDERWWVWPPGASFLDFLNIPVRNFFLGQSLAERGEEWPFGEWQHGLDGVFTLYQNLLQTEDAGIILRHLEFLSKPNAKGHWECPCGSKKKVRVCHGQQLRDLREKIPAAVAHTTLEKLKNTVKKTIS